MCIRDSRQAALHQGSVVCRWVVHRSRRPRLKPVSYTHLRAHETPEHLVCRLLLEKKKTKFLSFVVFLSSMFFLRFLGFVLEIFFFLMIRRPPRSTLDRSSAASDVYKRQAAQDGRG